MDSMMMVVDLLEIIIMILEHMETFIMLLLMQQDHYTYNLRINSSTTLNCVMAEGDVLSFTLMHATNNTWTI